LAVAIAALAAQLAGHAQAEPPRPPALVPPRPSLEMWSGGEAFADVWSLYSGLSWAPSGSVRDDGLRLRAVLGTGGYDDGRAAFAEVLIGYHTQLGPVTLKVFAGLTAAEHFPTAATSMLQGTALGPKALVETWWTITDKAWASLDLAFALPHLHMSIADAADPSGIDYSGRLRLGWRLWPQLSIGVEGGAGGPLAPTLQTTWQTSATRAGGFLRYEWAEGEVSISGGASFDGDERDWLGQAFGTVSVLTRF
jgi:hypothetical protein